MTEKKPAPPPRQLPFSNIRLVLAWVVCLSVAAAMFSYAWSFFDRPQRRDGNSGHTTIDFASQWLMGRMILDGEGRRLYDLPTIRRVLERNYPRADEDPRQEQSDVDKVMDWLPKGDGKTAPVALGGSLYPPIHGVIFAPLSLLPPRSAYRVMQVLNLVLVFVLGWVAERLSNGRVWWPVATLLLLLMPGCSGVFCLGQNSLLSLLVLTLGWWQMLRHRPLVAGALWGLLAFKPVWAVAFFPVPILTGRWRMALAMAAMGLTLVALTLPMVGVPRWFDWIAIGRLATAGYDGFVTWILFSRDLQGLVRRWYLPDASAFWPSALALGLWLAVGATTVVVALLRRRVVQAYQGPGAAFILLGGWLSGFHFMYYDTVLTALPLLLLFAQPGSKGWRTKLWGTFPTCLKRSTLETCPTVLSASSKKLVPCVALALLAAFTHILMWFDPRCEYLAIDTYLLLGLWAWCGWQTIAAKE